MVLFIKPFNIINMSVICHSYNILISYFKQQSKMQSRQKVSSQGVSSYADTFTWEQEMFLLSFGLGCGCDRGSILAWPAPRASIWGGRAPWGRGPSTAQGRRWSLLRGLQTLILWWHSVQRHKHIHYMCYYDPGVKETPTKLRLFPV